MTPHQPTPSREPESRESARWIPGSRLPTLTASRLKLRWLIEQNAADLFAIFSDPRVMRYWSSPPWTEAAAASELIEQVHQHFKAGSLYQWGVARNDDNVVIGTCTLCNLDRQNRRAELGFILRHDHWGQGYMSEATARLLQFCFEQLGLHRIEADVDPRNQASIKLLQRLGFVREGYLRERWLVGDEVNDTVFYGLLRSEWLARRQRSSV